MPQAGQDPAFDQEHRRLDLGFVLRAIRSGGEDRRAVMGGQIAVCRVEFGIIEAGGGDPALEVVWHQESRTTLEVLEGAHMAANPVRQALAPEPALAKAGVASQ